MNCPSLFDDGNFRPIALFSSNMLQHKPKRLSIDQPKSLVILVSLSARFLPTLFVLCILGLGWLAVHEINSGTSKEPEAPSSKNGGESDALRLPEGKIEAGKFLSTPVEMQLVQQRQEVSGRIQYDENKHIEVKSPLDGIIAELLVKPGDRIEKEQLVLVIKSPEIGLARSEVLKRQQMLQIAEQKLNRERELSKNLYDFFKQLDQGRNEKEIEEAFSNRPLGNFRQELLSSYSKLKLAQALIDNGKSVSDSGAISGRNLREREADLAVASASFQTVRDQSSFVSKQTKLQAEAEADDAQRQADIAQQSLEALLGYSEQVVNVDSVDALSRLEIRAPFFSTVENRMRSQNERIIKGESLLVLADTQSLYVAAEIRETDWVAVAVKESTVLSVTIPALENQTFQAMVHYVGREVSPVSNSIPIIAKIENRNGLLRPGMFARISIPVGSPRKLLAVKPEAIVQHDNQKFVFVEMDRGIYKKVVIVTGTVSDEWVEIVDGLVLGQNVVERGAFLLKSELLLEGESE
ncbi:MAG: efflux RND transporter periplasmic adaptor subunit [Pirellulaceae bacterium]|nr:efflux RND transporter periplasmic adaptor subunit [Pirellulaceae bacterium]